MTATRPPPEIKRLTDLSPTGIAAGADVYAEAFDPDTFYVLDHIWGATPDRQARQYLQFQQYVHRAINSRNEMYAAYLPGSSAPESVLVLKLPVDDGVDEKPPTPFDADVLASVPVDVEEREKRMSERKDGMKASALADEARRMYNISFVATRPRAERKGLASAMIRMCLERARADGRKVSLTTHAPDKAAFYERLGFKMRGYACWDGEDGIAHTWYCMVADPGGAPTEPKATQ